MFKAANNYDIYDPENNQIILNCRENNLGIFTKIIRFTRYKTMTPFNVAVSTTDGEKVLSVKRGVAFFVPMLKFTTEKNN